MDEKCSAPLVFAQFLSVEIFVISTVNRDLVGNSESTFRSITWGNPKLAIVSCCFPRRTLLHIVNKVTILTKIFYAWVLFVL